MTPGWSGAAGVRHVFQGRARPRGGRHLPRVALEVEGRIVCHVGSQLRGHAPSGPVALACLHQLWLQVTVQNVLCARSGRRWLIWEVISETTDQGVGVRQGRGAAVDVALGNPVRPRVWELSPAGVSASGERESGVHPREGAVFIPRRPRPSCRLAASVGDSSLSPLPCQWPRESPRGVSQCAPRRGGGGAASAGTTGAH